MVKSLMYYVQQGGQFEALYEYPTNAIEQDEIYARQLCEFFIKNGKEYELESNEMSGLDDLLIVKEKGNSKRFSEETHYQSGIHLEIRQFKNLGDMNLLKVIPLDSHWHAMRYLLKDVIDIPGIGAKIRDSAEIDEDRKCYVIYVTDL
jgi:hypothetical protein